MTADQNSSVAKPDPAELCKLQTQEIPAQLNCVLIYGKIPLSLIRGNHIQNNCKKKAIYEYEHVYGPVPTGILSTDTHDLWFLIICKFSTQLVCDLIFN